MKLLFMLIGALLSVGAVWADLPADPAEYAGWEARMLAAVEAQRDKPPDESIPKLGRWVYQMALPTNEEREGRPVYTAAVKMIVSIPGHAEYYGDRILDTYQELRRAMAAGVNASSQMGAYQRESMWGFQTLAHLPSPETVRVLSDMLSDEWQNPIPIEGNMRESPISHYALRALSSLPLVNKPSQPKDHELSGALRGWQLWYEQVKAGNRTFRFEGDPAEYTLEGRAAVALSPSVGSRSRASGAASQPDEAENEDASPILVTVLAAAALLFAGALAYSVRSRRQRA